MAKTKSADGISYNTAISAIGDEYALTTRQSSVLWGSEIDYLDFKVPYSPRVLIDKRIQNREHGQRWRLYIDPGFSVFRILVKIGSDAGRGSEHLSILGLNGQPTVALINFQGLHADCHWNYQNRQLPMGTVRPKERTVLAGMVGFAGYKKERLIPDWSHWGPSSGGNNHYIAVGMRRGAYYVGSYDANHGEPFLRLCVQLQ